MWRGYNCESIKIKGAIVKTYQQGQQIQIGLDADKIEDGKTVTICKENSKKNLMIKSTFEFLFTIIDSS